MNKSLARFKTTLSIRSSHRDSDNKLVGVFIYVYIDYNKQIAVECRPSDKVINKLTTLLMQ